MAQTPKKHGGFVCGYGCGYPKIDGWFLDGSIMYGDFLCFDPSP